MNYFSGQGNVYVGLRDETTGAPLALRHIGNVPEFKLNGSVEKVEHKESMSGHRQTDLVISTTKKMSLTLVLEEWTAKNLALALYGTEVTVSADSVTDEALPDSLAVGDVVALAEPDVSSLAIEDSLSAALTLDTHYEIVNAKTGLIRILDLAAFTQPFAASYDYAARTDVAMFNSAPPERFILFDGLNTTESDNGAFEPMRVDLYRVHLDPPADVGLIVDELSPLSLSGEVLADTLRAVDATLGQFGRITRLTGV